MKPLKISLFLALFLFATSAFSQDIIQFKNGRTVEAKILEMSDESVRYKKWNYQDGPDVNAPMSKVASITYANGETEVFDEEPASEPVAEAVPEAVAEPVSAESSEDQQAELVDETESQEVAYAPEEQTPAVKKRPVESNAKKKKKRLVYVEESAEEEEYEDAEEAPRKNARKEKLSPTENPESVWSRARANGVSVWAQPLGFILWGPMVGIGFRQATNFSIDVNVRLPQLGYTYKAVSDDPDEITGFAVGLQVRKLFAMNSGAWFLGSFFDAGMTQALYDKGLTGETEYQWLTFIASVQGGYRFMIGPHFYLDVGLVFGTLFVSDNDWRYSNPANSSYSIDFNRVKDGFISPFGMVVLTAGIEF